MLRCRSVRPVAESSLNRSCTAIVACTISSMVGARSTGASFSSSGLRSISCPSVAPFASDDRATVPKIRPLNLGSSLFARYFRAGPKRERAPKGPLRIEHDYDRRDVIDANHDTRRADQLSRGAATRLRLLNDDLAPSIFGLRRRIRRTVTGRERASSGADDVDFASDYRVVLIPDYPKGQYARRRVSLPRPRIHASCPEHP